MTGLILIIFILVLIVLVQAIRMERDSEMFESTVQALNDQKRKLVDDTERAAEDMQKRKRWKK